MEIDRTALIDERQRVISDVRTWVKSRSMEQPRPVGPFIEFAGGRGPSKVGNAKSSHATATPAAMNSVKGASFTHGRYHCSPLVPRPAWLKSKKLESD